MSFIPFGIASNNFESFKMLIINFSLSIALLLHISLVIIFAAMEAVSRKLVKIYLRPKSNALRLKVDAAYESNDVMPECPYLKYRGSTAHSCALKQEKSAGVRRISSSKLSQGAL